MLWRLQQLLLQLSPLSPTAAPFLSLRDHHVAALALVALIGTTTLFTIHCLGKKLLPSARQLRPVVLRPRSWRSEPPRRLWEDSPSTSAVNAQNNFGGVHGRP